VGAKKRGRPLGPGKLRSDIKLVQFVRRAKKRGFTIEEACRAFRRIEGRGNVESLVRRYSRVATAFPELDRPAPRLPGIRVPITVLASGGLVLARKPTR
jgi:hypothetical protein